MTRPIYLAIFFSIVIALPTLGTETIKVLPPNATVYSAPELAALLPALDDLTTVLNDYTLGSHRYINPGDWISFDFSAYTAGTLAERGYETRLVSQGGWPDGVHTWVLVGIPLISRTAWIPVEASPDQGKSQPILGYIPSFTDTTGKKWFIAAYLNFSDEIQLPANQPPVALIRSVPSRSTTNEEVTFMAVTSYDPDGEIMRYYWDLGDGMAAEARNVRHAFATAGTYTVSLIVTDSRGASATASIAFRVKEPGKNTGRGCGCGK